MHAVQLFQHIRKHQKCRKCSGGSKCVGTVSTLLLTSYTFRGSKCAGTVPTLLVAPNVPEQFLHFWWLQMCRNSSYTSGGSKCASGGSKCAGTVPTLLVAPNVPLVTPNVPLVAPNGDSVKG